MSLLNRLLGVYNVRMKCTNCHAVQDVKVPRGEEAESFSKDETCICYFCGCNTLRLPKKEEKARMTIQKAIDTRYGSTKPKKKLFDVFKDGETYY